MPFRFKDIDLEILVRTNAITIEGIGRYDGRVTTIYEDAEHVCNAQGYNPMLGDSCMACDESQENREMMDAAKVYLREKGVLSEYRL